MTADIGCSAKTSRCRRCPPRPSRAGALLTADTHVSCPHSSFRVLSPRVSSVSSVAATSHCRHGFFSDAVQAASSLVRSFPVHVPSKSSRCPLSLFSIFSRSPLSLLTLFLCSNVLPRLTRRALASSPHIVASPSHASLIACLHYFSRSPCTYPQVQNSAQNMKKSEISYFIREKMLTIFG